MAAVGADRDKIASAFNEQFDKDARLALPGVVSRKKQVVPPMQSTFEGELSSLIAHNCSKESRS